MLASSEIQLSSLAPVFSPSSIVVYGASSDPTKIGGRPLRYLKELGFKGKLYAINPAHSSIQGVPSFANVAAIPDAVDLAVIVVPGEAVLPAVQDCVRMGVKGLVVMSSGFSETGDKGSIMQNEVAAVAKAGGIRMLGPNCLGYVNAAQGLSVTFSPSRELRWPRLGAIGFVTQSGAFGSHCAAVCSNRGIGLGTWITTGNEADIDVADCIAYLANDNATKVIAGYIEGCRDAEKMARAFELARSAGKPVILLKAGTTDVGAAAVVSHTAVMAGRDELFEVFFRQHGVIRAHDVDELLDIAYACAAGIRPNSSRAAVISTSGGVAVMMADAAIKQGLLVEPLAAKVQAEVKAILPFAGTRNPIDTTAQMVNDIGVFSKCFEIVVSASSNDIVVAHISFIGYDTALMERVYEPLARLRTAYPERLFILSMLSEQPVRERYEAAGFLVFEDPTRAIRAAARCRQSAIFLRSPQAERDGSAEADAPAMEGDLSTEHAAKQWLRTAGIAVPKEQIVRSSEDAIRAAEVIGFPVVMKVVSPDIIHKTEVGGVLIGLDSAGAVAAGYQQLIDRVKKNAPAARIEGILVEQQISGGVEMIAGIVNDKVLGPFVMCGLGGIFAEVLSDVVFRRVPFLHAEALEMIRELRSFALLNGARGLPRADTESLAKILVRLSGIAARNSDCLDSMDINPLIVTASGACAADVVIVRKPAASGVVL